MLRAEEYGRGAVCLGPGLAVVDDGTEIAEESRDSEGGGLGQSWCSAWTYTVFQRADERFP
jgi:hypothetical protein